MEYLLISSIIQSIILFYLLHKVHKLEKPVKPIEPDRLKKLEHFYKQIYKKPEMIEWSELKNDDKVKLFNSSEYLSYDFDLAKADVKKAFQRTFLFRKIQIFVEWLSRLLA